MKQIDENPSGNPFDMIDANLDLFFERFVRDFSLDDQPTTSLLKSLIHDESERTNAEIIQCLEFIYSHIINKFQGDLAEAYALELCTVLEKEWKKEGRLPPDAEYVWSAIMEKSSDYHSRDKGEGWRKGADGLFLMEEQIPGSDNTTNLLILGVVEVKSYSLAYKRASVQIEKHLFRLRHGLKIGDRKWPAERLFFMRFDPTSKNWSRSSVLENTRREVLRLLIKPAPARHKEKHGSRPALPPSAYEITLPHPKSKFAADAYIMTVWFIERLGRKVFMEHPNPWPDLTLEEAGSNALQEALYHIGLRRLPTRQHKIGMRLYNVYGFGYDNAHVHKDMIWSVQGNLVSDSKPPEPSLVVHAGMKLDDVVDTAWSFYRQGLMDEAMSYIRTALTMRPDESLCRRLHRLQGMIHYFRGEFEDAARIFPQPLEGQPDDWWARDKLTLAKIFARINRLDEASSQIATVAEAGRKDLSLAVSIPAIEAMVMIKRDQIVPAQYRLNTAFDELKKLCDMINNRKQKGLGNPVYYNPSAVHEAAFDTATGFVIAGDLGKAIHILSGIDEYIFPPNLLLLEKDQSLEALRTDKQYGPQFFKWLSAVKS